MRTAIGGGTARFDIEVFDVNDVAVTGLASGAFTKYLTIDGVTDATAVTVTEVANGRYTVTFTAPTVAAGSAMKYVRARVLHSTYGPRGWAEDFEVYNTSLGFATDVAGGDESIDKTTPTHWQQVVKGKGTSTELVRKKLYEADGTTKIASTTQIVGQRTET